MPGVLAGRLPIRVGMYPPPADGSRGWHEDPKGTGMFRYWDGVTWSQTTAAVAWAPPPDPNDDPLDDEYEYAPDTVSDIRDKILIGEPVNAPRSRWVWFFVLLVGGVLVVGLLPGDGFIVEMIKVLAFCAVAYVVFGPRNDPLEGRVKSLPFPVGWPYTRMLRAENPEDRLPGYRLRRRKRK